MTVEIRDPQIDSKLILNRVAARAAAHPPELDPVRRGPASLRPRNEEHSSVDAMPALEDALIELMVNHRLHEPEFQSPTPVIGSLIVAVRRAWNWMATKWYVRPILHEQSLINARLAMLLVQMGEWQAQQEAEIQQLHRELAQLRQTATGSGEK